MPPISLAVGLVVSIILGSVLGNLVRTFAESLAHLSAPWAFPLPAMFVTALSFLGSLGKTPPGWVGIPQVFGQRLRGVLLTEGYHWLLWGVLSAINIDCRKEFPSRWLDFKFVSSDGIEMTGRLFWTYNISDPYGYASSEDPIVTMDNKALEIARRTGSSCKCNELLEDSAKSEISNSLLEGLQREGVEHGLRVRLAGVPLLLPPQAVLDANAKKLVEEAVRAASAIDIRNVMERIAQLKDMGFTPQEAYQILATEKGELKRTLTEFGLSKPILNTLEIIVEQIFGKRIST